MAGKDVRDSLHLGTHLILDLWDAHHLDDAATVREALREAAEACRARLLSLDIHEFSPGGGVTGVALLEESHISIHTWPEHGFAAADIFVCGAIDPRPAVTVLKKRLSPGNAQVAEIKRGIR